MHPTPSILDNLEKQESNPNTKKNDTGKSGAKYSGFFGEVWFLPTDS
jgi:hypothetical protein